MTAGSRRNGSSKFGPVKRGSAGHHASFGPASGGGRTAGADHSAGDVPNAGRDHGHRTAMRGRRGEHYSGRHVSRRDKTARKRVGKVVPAAAVAATLAAGAAAYSLSGGNQPQAAQLNAAMGGVGLGNAASVGAGHANGAAATMIKAARAASNGAARAARAVAAGKGVATRKAAAAPKATASARPVPSTAASSGAVLGSPATANGNANGNVHSAGGRAATGGTTATPSAAASASARAKSSTPAASALSCAQTGGALPENVTAIVSFLLANGYSDNAAAGIAGNIYQESKGNPESEGMGGGGLIGWTPLPSGFVTGNVTADLQTQLAALLTYNQGWSAYLSALNSAASPADAAYIYVIYFERAGIPAAANREQAADDVAAACGI